MAADLDPAAAEQADMVARGLRSLQRDLAAARDVQDVRRRVGQWRDDVSSFVRRVAQQLETCKELRGSGALAAVMAAASLETGASAAASAARVAEALSLALRCDVRALFEELVARVLVPDGASAVAPTRDHGPSAAGAASELDARRMELEGALAAARGRGAGSDIAVCVELKAAIVAEMCGALRARYVRDLGRATEAGGAGHVGAAAPAPLAQSPDVRALVELVQAAEVALRALKRSQTASSAGERLADAVDRLQVSQRGGVRRAVAGVGACLCACAFARARSHLWVCVHAGA